VCVPGCRDDRDCVSGQYCTAEGQCAAGCTQDRDCPWGDYCLLAEHRCVDCLTDQHCIGGVCDPATHTCQRTCSDDWQCWPNVCDTSQDPGVCVECHAGDDSKCRQNGLVCDESARVCVECVVDEDCASTSAGPRYCLPEELRCVPCYDDAHCGQGEVCDRADYSCRATSGRALCEPCGADEGCGGAGDLCLSFSDLIG
jgi:Cys-rich repeat protein